MLAKWLVLILYLLMGAANLARGIMAFVVDTVLSISSPSLPLIGVVYVGWGAVHLASGLAYVSQSDPQRYVWVRRLVRAIAIFYQATMWGLRLIADRASYAQRLWTRDLVLTLVYLGAIFLLTAIDDPRASSRRR